MTIDTLVKNQGTVLQYLDYIFIAHQKEKDTLV